MHGWTQGQHIAMIEARERERGREDNEAICFLRLCAYTQRRHKAPLGRESKGNMILFKVPSAQRHNPTVDREEPPNSRIKWCCTKQKPLQAFVY